MVREGFSEAVTEKRRASQEVVWGMSIPGQGLVSSEWGWSEARLGQGQEKTTTRSFSVTVFNAHPQMITVAVLG